jgi:hypothetical protein
MRKLSVIAFLAVIACAEGDSGPSHNTFATLGSGDGADTDDESGDGDATTGDGDATTGDGDPTTGDGDPTTGDGDPTTGDGDPTTGDGDPTTGDGDPTTGDGDGDPTCQRKLYTRDFNNGSWDVLALDVAWTGPNAPPCAVEPLAATYLEPWDQLLVWGANGQFYRRIGVTWQPPEPFATRWAMLTNFDVEAAYYVPPLNNGVTCDVTFLSAPTALIYRVYQDGATSFQQAVEMSDEPPPGPPQASVARKWSLVLADPALLGQADWWVSWQGFANGQVYRVDGAFEWSGWPASQAPLFMNAPGSLDPALIEAGWGNYALNRAYLVGL